MFYHATHKQSALLFKKTSKPLKYIHGPSFYWFLIFTFSFWNNAQAEWTKYARSSNGDIHYFEQTNVNKNSSSIIIRNRVRYYASLMGAKSYESLLLINCKKRTERVLQHTYFNDANWSFPAMKPNKNVQPEKKIGSKTITSRLANIVCKSMDLETPIND